MKQKIKLILASVRQYKIYAIITPLFMVGEVLLESLIPFTMSMFLDTAIKITSFSDFTKLYDVDKLPFQVSLLGLLIAMIVMALLSITCGIGGGVFGAKASVGLATNLRSDLYKKIQTFSFANIDKFSTSSLVTRLTTDIANVQMAFQMCIRIVFRAPIMIIVSAIMAFVAGGHVAWVFVALIPIMGIGLFFIVKNAMSIFTKVFKRYDALNNSIQENVSGIRVVKAYVREDFEKEKFNNASDNIKTDFIKAEKIVALNTPLMNTTIHASNIIIIAISAFLIGKYSTVKDGVIFNQKLTIGQMSSLLTYGIQILVNIMMVSMILVMITMSLEAVRRIGEVLLEEPTIKNPENPLYEVKDGSIDFNHVDFKYNDLAQKNALTDIDIHIKSGQVVGILGTTGSGKTSVINLISRLYDTSKGEVLVAGENVKNYDLVTLRDNVAVVLQKNVLFSGTIADNLRWGKQDATEEEMMKACEIAQANEFISSFSDGLNTHIEQGGTNVSGGQKQRLCIARAILKSPKILILDDSTSAVDTKTDKIIRKHLKEDLPTMTKIIIAQRVSSIENADQIIIMENGTIVAIGNHESLLKTSPIYKEIYETQNKVGGDK